MQFRHHFKSEILRYCKILSVLQHPKCFQQQIRQTYNETTKFIKFISGWSIFLPRVLTKYAEYLVSSSLQQNIFSFLFSQSEKFRIFFAGILCVRSAFFLTVSEYFHVKCKKSTIKTSNRYFGKCEYQMSWNIQII